MVLLHGKEVQPLPAPPPVAKDHEGFLIEPTNEWFATYEAYLARHDFYMKKQFTDQIYRHTKMTYFDALRAEHRGTQHIEADFPEPLKGPILRKVHMDTTGRLEDLVSMLFSTWNENILPGENVYVLSPERRTKSAGIVRDKAIFAPNKERPEITRFFVQMPTSDATEHPVEIVVESERIQRKPKTFTKAAITQFLRHTVDRDRYEGAPWVVKQPYAARYGLDTRIPTHLTASAIALERKQQALVKKGRIPALPDAFIVKNNEIVPKPGHNPSDSELQIVRDRFSKDTINGQQVLQMRPATNGKATGGSFGEIQFQPPAAPPVKYPIEDLDLEPRRTAAQRPPLKDFTKHCPFPDESVLDGKERLQMAYVGSLLEVWNTFQVFGPSFFFVDGFTLDDFLGAMMISSDKLPCQMFSELHCAVLQRLIDKDGELLVKSLAAVLTAEEQQAEDAETSEPGSPDDEDDTEATENSDASSSLPATHRAKELAQSHNWMRIVHTGKLADGGWQLAMVGLLEHLSRAVKVMRPACDEILEHLVPLDQDITKQAVRVRYSNLGVNLRVQALELATRMVIETRAFKFKMNEIMGGATATRKEKTSNQSQRKLLLKELEDLDQQRKLQRPDNMPDTNGDATGNGGFDVDVEMADGGTDRSYGDRTESEDDSSEDEDASIAMNRRKSDRMANLKRKREEEEELERVEKLQINKEEAAAYMTILKEIRRVKDEVARCEEEIARLDDDLRENFCHRTKLIGRDRYINRYHWFERNGMPLEGDQDSSTVYGYANGRLWIQGGDALDRSGILDLEPADEKAHRSRFKMSIQERRSLDEGVTQLNGADEWGYYDEPQEIDRLLSWLKDKGEREKKLKKELNAWQDPIVKAMENLKQHLVDVGKKLEEHEERPQRGVALRKKAAAELNQAKYPCTIWHNSTALQEFGILLGDGRVEFPADEENAAEEDKPVEKEKAPAKKKTRKAAEERAREASAVPEQRVTRRGTRKAR